MKHPIRFCKLLLTCPLMMACMGSSVEDRAYQSPDSETDPPTYAVGFDKSDRSQQEPIVPNPVYHPPHALLLVNTAGDLCQIDPVSGELIDVEPANAIDLYASPFMPGAALATEWNEEGGGFITELETSPQGLHRTGSFPLSVDDARLIHGPDPTLALAIHEGTTIFDGVEGRTVFGTSSFWVKNRDDFLDIWLLERAHSHPQLANLRWEKGLRELSRTPVPTKTFACPPRLVRDALEPMLVGAHAGTVIIQTPSGLVMLEAPEVAAPDACVEDALWLSGTGDLVVLTGPNARIHLLSISEKRVRETLVTSAVLYHDPNPRRRFAYDPLSNRLWTALSTQVDVREYTEQERLDRVELDVACDGESVTLLW